jgi:hypothetical protein
MAKDLIIGGASNYTWDDLKYWVNSIKKSGFDGDVAIVGTNMSKETIEKLTQEGVLLSLYGKMQDDGSVVAHNNGAPHVERFFYMWNYLNSLDPKQYTHLITTDTRDVVFQTNPTDWLYDNCMGSFLVCSSEGLRYKNEPWGNKNLHDTFGPYFHNILKEKMIYNVGTIAGNFEFVRDLMLMIFQMSVNRPIPIVDQAVFNFLINFQPYNMDTLFTNNSDNWAIQLGTTVEAVKAGRGDLGVIFNDDPSRYEALYEDNQPVINEDGTVTSMNENKKYVIVHQYDRVPHLKTKIEELYGD